MTLFHLFPSLFIVAIGSSGISMQNADAAVTPADDKDSLLEVEACNSWINLQRTLTDLDKIKFMCTVNLDCTGIGCLATSQSIKGTINARVEHCTAEKPPRLLVAIQVPQLHVNWNHTFFQSEKISLSDSGLSTSELPIDPLDQTFQIHMQVLDEHRFVFGIAAVKGIIPSINLLQNQTFTLPPCGTAGRWSEETVEAVHRQFAKLKPVIIDQENESKVVLGTVTSDGKSCDMGTLGECDAGETCEQVAPGEMRGICKCLLHYHRSVQGTCEADPTVPSSTDEPSAKAHKSDDDENGEGSLYAVKVGVSIFVVAILLTVLTVSAYKYRWVPQIRARFQRARPYEEMIIDGDYNVTSQSTNMSSNPVV